MTAARRPESVVAVLLGLVAFLPFLRGVVGGASLYFRDLGVYFFPLRRLALDSLRSGEVPLWNPYLHEGVPVSPPALGYVPDVLQLLRPDEVGISLVLALHVPLAALGFYALGRRVLEAPRAAAAGGALMYALGGFLLSTVNLYVALEAAAWAPLLTLTLVRAAGGRGGRPVALASIVLAVALSTTGVEIVAQAVVAAALLGLRSPGRDLARSLARQGAALVLGSALAAPVLVLVAAQVGTSARGAGLATEVVLAHSIHPFTLVQTLVGGLYGNLANLAGEWWGQNFFPRGFPYILSLYIGPSALALAAMGARGRNPLRVRLVLLAGVALVACLGRFAGLAPLIEAAPALRLFRYPVKAFFTVHLAVALLGTLGLAELGRPEARRAWMRLSVAAGILGGVLVVLPLVPHLAPARASAFGAAFFPPGLDAATRSALLGRVVADAATGGAVALAVAAVAVFARSGLLVPARASLLVLLLLGGDLLRTGGGLNPMVSSEFFRPSPELAGRLDVLRGRRVFTCPFDGSAAYRQARLARGTAHEIWTFAVALETLTPAFNVPFRVPTAMSHDLTMLVPEDRALPALDPACRDLEALVPRLRRAGADTLLSLDPLTHPDLRFESEWRPERLAPVAVRQYRLASALPRLAVAAEVVPVTSAAAGAARAAEEGFLERGGAAVEGHPAVEDARGAVVTSYTDASSLALEVEADRPSVAVVRDGWARGWTATLDGQAARVLRVDGRHRGVAVPAGRHAVRMRYRPPLILAGIAIGALALAGTVLLGRRAGRPPVGTGSL